ncbi:MAG: DNA translocase FtsK 4TM domain-containing protein [Fusobacteriota bacterium]
MLKFNRKYMKNKELIMKNIEGIKNELLGILFTGIGGYISYILIKDLGQTKVGILGQQLHKGLFFLIGDLSYLLPVILILYGFVFLVNKKVKINKLKLVAFIIFFLLLLSLMVMSQMDINNTQEVGKGVKEILRIGGNRSSGGMIGAIISIALFTLFGNPGAIIILLTLMSLSLFIFANQLIKSLVKGIFVNLKNIKMPKLKKKVSTKIKKVNKNNKPEKIKKRIKLKKQDKRLKQKKKSINSKESKNKEIKKTTKTREPSKNKVAIQNKKTDSGSEVKVEGLFDEKNNSDQDVKEIKKQIEHKIENLERVLLEHKIEAKVINYERGPVITRFELSIPRGVRVKKIVARTDDIAMNLAAKSIRIEAPIPGKNAVGIEIPNDVKEAVYFSSLIKTKQYKNSDAKLKLILGNNIVGDHIIVDLTEMPHLLIAGRTGSGKSVCINTLISGMISKMSPEEVKFILVDPKMVELMPYNDIPHLLVPVITNPKLAATALKWTVNEMEDRYKKLSKLQVRNLESYNKKSSEENLPYIVVVIDELADLMMVASSSVETSISRIAQKARAVGIHLIIATQRPSTDVVTGTIKANLPSRISFSVASQIDSRTILDTSGAEKLLGKGDMLFLESGSPNLSRIQGAFITDEEVVKLTEYLKKQRSPEYNEKVTSQEFNKETDELFDKAIEVIKEAEKVSISLLQRKLRVGYARAGRIVDDLEENGIISSDREILIDV